MQKNWASFWEHVEDLRHVLMRIFLVIGIGFILALMFYQPILQFLSAFPIEQPKGSLTTQRIQKIQIANNSLQPQIFELPLNARLLSPIFPGQKENPNHFTLLPGQSLLYEEVEQPSFLVMGPLEGLILVFKICFWISLCLTAPIWSWFGLQFVLPGLYQRERSFLFIFLISSLCCLILGIAAAYYVTLPIANQSLFLFNSTIGQNAWTLAHYINYVLILCFGHAIAAELALFLFILVRFGFLPSEWLITQRRWMIVLAFVLGALLTPPDVLTQLLLAIPLVILYEFAILYAKWIARKNKKELLDSDMN